MDDARPNGSLTVFELEQERWTQLVSEDARQVASLLDDPDRLVWVDVWGEDPDASVLIGELAKASSSLPGLDPVRAVRQETDPSSRPPKAKAFRDFVFSRAYWLWVRPTEDDVEVVAQEVHLMAGRTFAITVRFPCRSWTRRRMASGLDDPSTRSDDPGVDLEQLRTEVVGFRERIPGGDPKNVFGLEVAAVIVDDVVDSVFRCIDELRQTAERTEIRVLRKNEWLWHQRRWPEIDSEILGLRRLLGKVRWAFLPDDEIEEFCSGPFIKACAEDEGIKFRLNDLAREAVRAVDAVRDVKDQVANTVELRDSMKTDRLNSTTYVLAAVATILLIPTLIAGIYGMNFRTMPGLGWRAGFWEALGAMMLLGAGAWVAISAYLRRH
jgi:magnesium transporter